MMSPLLSKYRKLIRDLQFLYSELEYFTEEHEFRKQEFHEDFTKYCEDAGYDCSRRETAEQFEKKQVDVYNAEISESEMDEINSEVMEDPEDESIDPDDAERDLKTLYKKIATHTHPDKIKESELEEARNRKKQLFMDAKQAVDEKNFYRLCQIAEELGVDLPPPTRQQLLWMRKEKKKIEKIIAGVKQTFEWVSGEDDQLDSKKELFRRYTQAIGCVKLEKVVV